MFLESVLRRRKPLEKGALWERVGKRKAIESLSKASFDAIGYTFTPWMEWGEMPWNGNDYVAYVKEVNQIAKELILNADEERFAAVSRDKRT